MQAADDDIAAFEFGRSQGQQMADPGWVEFGIPTSADSERIWRAASLGGNTTQMFLDEPAARTATLGILRLRGDWDAADELQEELIGDGSPFLDPPYAGKLIEQTTPEAKRIITVDWGITSVNGLTTVTSRRRLLRTRPFDQQLPVSGQTFTLRSHIEVDKLATFALDIDRLDTIDHEAAQEVRLIIVCGLLATTDLRRVQRAALGVPTWQDFQAGGEKSLRDERLKVITARAKINQYGLASDAVVNRLTTEDQTRLQRPESIEAIEGEIANPSGLLTPSTVTFYGERVPHSMTST